MYSAMLHYQTLTCLASRFLELSCSPSNTDFLMIACIATFCRPRLVITGPPWFWLWFHATSFASFSRAFSKEPCGLRMPARLSANAEVPTVNTHVRMCTSYLPDYKNYKTQNIKFMKKQYFCEIWHSHRGVLNISLLWFNTNVSKNHTEYYYPVPELCCSVIHMSQHSPWSAGGGLWGPTMSNESSGVEVPVAALPQLLVSDGAGEGNLVRLSSSSSLIRSPGGTCWPPTASNIMEDSSVLGDDLYKHYKRHINVECNKLLLDCHDINDPPLVHQLTSTIKSK
jgi:hypothetical protein